MAACANCHQREGTLIWAEGTIAWIHGMYAKWCLQCVLTAQLKHARERAAEIPELEAKLLKLQLDSGSSPDPA